MGEVYIVRHGEADRRLSDTFGEYTMMNEHGERQIRTAANALKEVLRDRKIDSLETALSDRSAENGKLLAGVLGTSTLNDRSKLLHRADDPDVMRQQMTEWVMDKDTGLYVAVMSGMAIRAFLANQGLVHPTAVPDGVLSDGVVPCGSVTHIYTSKNRDPVVEYFGKSPDKLLAA